MKKIVKITEEEILETPNDATLGKLIREKYYKNKDGCNI